MSEKTKFDKTLNWFKNKSLFVALFVILIAYYGVTEFIENTKKNRDNLFGENGLFRNENDSTVSESKKLEPEEQIKEKAKDLNANQKGHSKPTEKEAAIPNSSPSTLELSIYLDEKSQGYRSVFVNGAETPTLPESTRLNPRMIFHGDIKEPQKITVVTNSGDTCFIYQTFSKETNSNKPIVLVPNNCK